MQALIPLALVDTDMGKLKAAHALAKIAAVSNPDIAFPGEQVGVWVSGKGLWEQSPLLLRAFILVTLILAWEEAGAVKEKTINWSSRPSSACA